MISEATTGLADRVSSRREWIRTGFRAVLLLGLGGIVCLLLRRTGYGNPCFRATCRNCSEVSNCRVRIATMVQSAGPFAPNGKLEP